MHVDTTKADGFPVHQKVPQIALTSGVFCGCGGGGGGGADRLTKILEYKLLSHYFHGAY